MSEITRREAVQGVVLVGAGALLSGSNAAAAQPAERRQAIANGLGKGKKSSKLFYIIVDDDGKPKEVHCHGKGDKCFVHELLMPEPNDIHDADLARATREINGLLDRVASSNKQADRELAFLVTPAGLLLAWVKPRPDIISHDDDQVSRVLGIE